jgi:hypothetical protein
MKLCTLQTATGRVLRIETDEDLDLRAHGVFEDACRLAEYPNLSAIEVSLAKTRNIRGSGVEMLLRLHQRANGLRKRIRLVNCSAEIRRQLTASYVGNHFQVI